MIKNYVEKIILNKENKKYTVIAAIAIFTICFFVFDLSGLLGRLFTSIGSLFSNVDGEVKQVVIKSDGYDEGIGGNIKITKSADWSSNESITILYEVDSILRESDNNKDVILVLDNSSIITNSDLESLKRETSEVISKILLDDGNNVGIITYNSQASILIELTNDEKSLLESIDTIKLGDRTRNWYYALLEVSEILRNYEKSNNRELIILFVSGGAPTSGSLANANAQYEVIKSKYSLSKIYGISYKSDGTLNDSLKKVSDEQYSSSNSKNIFLELALNSKYYDSFELIEYLSNNYYVESVDDITVSVGSVNIDNKNNQQQIIWKVNKDEFRTGRSEKMEIKLKLKLDLIGVEGLYSTSEKISASYILENGNVQFIESEETTILKNGYKIVYNVNAPSGCDLKFDYEEVKYAYDYVNYINSNFNCDGWNFQGWSVSNDVKYITDTTFVMPTNNIIINGIWSKLYLNKTMEGSINAATSLVYDFDYTGEVETFVAPYTGSYKLEVWGAQGGTAEGETHYDGYLSNRGGYGGYAVGTVELTKGEELYIVVGEQGKWGYPTQTILGGYNGGGSVLLKGDTNSNRYVSGGGGATHIAINNNLGELKNYENNQEDILLVAGGGGGAYIHMTSGYTGGPGGDGGGNTGVDGSNGNLGGYYGTGGTQTTGGTAYTKISVGVGTFGLGGSVTTYSHGSAGGGGWYGGGASNGEVRANGNSSGGGGSGYIGNSLLSDKYMVCYECITSDDANTKTNSTSNVSDKAISNYAKQENGYVRITFIG